MSKEKKSKPTKSKKKTKNPDTNHAEPEVTDATAAEVIADLAESMSERGYWPVLTAFQDADGRIEVYTKTGVNVARFLEHLVHEWLPRAMARPGASQRRAVH